MLSLRSFRWRLALMTAGVAGVVLCVFIGLTFQTVRRINLHQIDEDIREFGQRQLNGPHGPQHWERAGEALRYFLGTEEENAFILLVIGLEGQTVFRTPNWPENLAVERFPVPEPGDGFEFSRPPADVERGFPPGLGQRQSGGRGFRRGASEIFETDLPPGEPDGAMQQWPRGERRGPPPRFLPPSPPVPLSRVEFFTSENDGVSWRVGVMGSPGTTLVLGINMERISREMALVRRAVFMLLPLSLLLIAGGAWWISGRGLRPIRMLTSAVERVTAKGLDQRISGQNEDREFSRLITVFNEMLERLEKSFHQAIRFSADASHELKTPLTILQGQLEQAVHEAAPGSNEQRRYSTLAKEVQRLTAITRKLLLLSRVDAGELKLNLRPLDLSQLIEAVGEDTVILAGGELEVQSSIVPGIWVLADADLMKQVVQNLASNALKYNQKGGFIRLTLQGDERRVRFTVRNSGRGIAPEDRGKVFERFYRGDKARSRQVDGLGLGLSLAREIVRAHNGDLILEETPPGVTTFTMMLPRARQG